MATKQNIKFNGRAFTSLYISFSGIIMALSGIILYLAPAGRIAKWSRIYILGMEKADWQAVHTVFTFMFIIAGAFHIWYNWKPLVSYFRRKLQQKIVLRKELFASFTVTALLFVATLFNVPPFSSIMELGESLSDSWSTEQTEPPVPHAEAMTFVELAKAVDRPVDGLLEMLRKENIAAQKEEVLKDVAEKYNLTPMELFARMKAVKTPSASSPYAGKGLGRKTLAEVCPELKVELPKALQALREKGIEASAEQTIKDIASQAALTPLDIMEIINPSSKGY